MYFNIYSFETHTYVKNFDYIDLNKNIELYELKREITKIEERFYEEYEQLKYDYYLCISNSEYDKDREV